MLEIINIVYLIFVALLSYNMTLYQTNSIWADAVPLPPLIPLVITCDISLDKVDSTVEALPASISTEGGSDEAPKQPESNEQQPSTSNSENYGITPRSKSTVEEEQQQPVIQVPSIPNITITSSAGEDKQNLSTSKENNTTTESNGTNNGTSDSNNAEPKSPRDGEDNILLTSRSNLTMSNSPSSRKRTVDDFEYGEVLGEGSFGEVFTSIILSSNVS